MRVLIVEDHLDTADTLAVLFEFRGLEVQIAHDGPTALRVAEEFAPDAVILDIGLPGGLNGWDIARRLKSGTGKVPHLIAVSGYARQEDRMLSAAAGIDLHLAKPVAPEALITLLEHLRDAPRNNGPATSR
jgi:DNA-binding response OmpR family regulator